MIQNYWKNRIRLWVNPANGYRELLRRGDLLRQIRDLGSALVRTSPRTRPAAIGHLKHGGLSDGRSRIEAMARWPGT